VRALAPDDWAVPDLSRSQLLVYGAIAVALLVVGARWVRGTGGEESASGGVAQASTASQAGGDDSFAFERGGEDVVVHVAGAVSEPGVYRLPGGSRVTDAIERAGGTTRTAMPDGINLAAPLADGQQIQVPARVPGGSSAGAGTSGASAGAAPDAPISIGTATVEQLDTIEGIGPVTAQEIIEFRDQRGGIASIEELDEITGIGPATMEALRASLQP
jgi:competence protein ComEA